MSEASSDSNGDVERVLMNYKKKLKEDFISNSVLIEVSEDSNISVNINMPSTSDASLISPSVGHAATTRNRKRNATKKSKKSNDLPSVTVEDSSSGKSTRRNPKRAANKSAKQTQNKDIKENAKDPDYVPPSKRNYSKLTMNELNSLAMRVRVFHETGIVVSDDEDVNQCGNKYKKRKTKNNDPKQRLEQVPGTQFGQGRVGTCQRGFGVTRCTCCNVSKNTPLIDLCSPHSSSMNSISQQALNNIRRREERLLQLQQQELLRHPELTEVYSDSNNDEQQIEIPEFSVEKRAWVQKFMDSMSVDRIDYDKPNQSNFVKAVEQKRPSDVVPLNSETIIDSLDTKTIIERVDFKKKSSSNARQSKLDQWLKFSLSKTQLDLPIATSTPRHAEDPSLNETDLSAIPGPSNVNTRLEFDPKIAANNEKNDHREVSSKAKTNLFKGTDPSVIAITNIEEESLDDISTDISHLDRSNITLRTPHSKSTNMAHKPSTSHPILEEKENDIMNFVDNLLEEEKDVLSHEANERFERWLENNRTTHNALHNALDSVIMINDYGLLDRDDIPHNNSVEIVDDYINVDEIVENAADDSVIILEDNDSVIPTIDLSGASTSRSGRGRRGRPARRVQKRTRPAVRSSSTEVPSSTQHTVQENEMNSANATGEPVPSTNTVPNETSVTEEPVHTGVRLRDCPVCWESLSNKEISSTICGHIFCTQCITAAVRTNRRCPNCRMALTLKKIHPLYL